MVNQGNYRPYLQNHHNRLPLQQRHNLQSPQHLQQLQQHQLQPSQPHRNHSPPNLLPPQAAITIAPATKTI